MTTSAISASAGGAALALAIMLSCRSIHEDRVGVALLGLNDVEGVATSLLHAVALVSTVAVAAARHGD